MIKLNLNNIYFCCKNLYFSPTSNEVENWSPFDFILVLKILNF